MISLVHHSTRNHHFTNEQTAQCIVTETYRTPARLGVLDKEKPYQILYFLFYFIIFIFRSPSGFTTSSSFRLFSASREEKVRIIKNYHFYDIKLLVKIIVFQSLFHKLGLLFLVYSMLDSYIFFSHCAIRIRATYDFAEKVED